MAVTMDSPTMNTLSKKKNANTLIVLKRTGVPYGLLAGLCLSLWGCDTDECDAHFADHASSDPQRSTAGICSGDSGAFKICKTNGGGDVHASNPPNYWQESHCPASHPACVPFDQGEGQDLGHQCTDPLEGVPCAMNPLLPPDSPTASTAWGTRPLLSDLDQDGDLDLIYLTNGAPWVIFQTSPMNFQDGQGLGRQHYSESVSSLRIGQLDGDGWLEAVVHVGQSKISVLMEPDITVGAPITPFAGEVLALIDVNGDGKAEALVNNNSEFEIHYNFGPSPSEADVVRTGLGMKEWGTMYGATVGGDARGDLVARSSQTFRDRTNSYLLVATDTGFERVWSGPADIGDLNSDGVADAVTMSAVKMGVGSGTVVDEFELETTGYDGVSWFGDVNGDGHLDAVQVPWNKRNPAHAPNQRISVYLGDGTGHLAPGVVYDPPDKAEFTVIGLEDLDGDGRADLVVVDRAGVVKVAPGTCQP